METWCLFSDGDVYLPDYPISESAAVIIKLPQSTQEKSISLDSALRQRATSREYLDTPLSLLNLSQLLFAAQGRRGGGEKRLAPSAQEQYPLSTFFVAHSVAGIAAGLYRYQNSDHSLAELEKGHFSGLLEAAAIGQQPWLETAAAVIVLAGNIEAMNRHFAEQPPLKQRGERYVYMEVGAAAQNVQLQATALDIAMVLVGGFDNEAVKSLLKLPTDIEPCALLCVGNG